MTDFQEVARQKAKELGIDLSGGELSRVDDARPIPVDWAMAFCQLAPLVAEARVFLLSGDTDKAKGLLEEARNCIKVATTVRVAVTAK